MQRASDPIPEAQPSTPLPPPEESSPPSMQGATADLALDEAWTRVEANWESDEFHKKYIALCMQLGALQDAGRRYREVRDKDEARKATAEKHIDEILVLAMQSLAASKTDPPPAMRNRRLLWIAAVVVLAMIMMVVGALLLSP